MSEGGIIETEMLGAVQELVVVHIWNFEQVADKGEGWIHGGEELKELRGQSFERIICVSIEITKI